MLPVVPRWACAAPGELLISSGLATMGFALPAAIAASLVHPDRVVVCFTGDGGLGMALAELGRSPGSALVSSSSSSTTRR